MKRIVITGKNSYIGNHIQTWLEQYQDQYVVDQLDVQAPKWSEYDFSHTDVVIHVAGIVHHPEITDWELYNKVNTELPIAIAKVAKDAGVKQFVFMSTMAVYGTPKRLAINLINKDTEMHPTDFYGKSKFLAEVGLKELGDKNFRIVIMRPPNVYGKGCKGGYISGFRSVISKIPAIPYAFPNVKQSMLYIDNLCELMRIIIEKEVSGEFMPQDKQAVSAVELMKAISIGAGKAKKESKFLGLAAYLLRFSSIVNKAYGGVAYDEKMSAYFDNAYVVIPFQEGIRRTVSDA